MERFRVECGGWICLYYNFYTWLNSRKTDLQMVHCIETINLFQQFIAVFRFIHLIVPKSSKKYPENQHICFYWKVPEDSVCTNKYPPQNYQCSSGLCSACVHLSQGDRCSIILYITILYNIFCTTLREKNPHTNHWFFHLRESVNF